MAYLLLLALVITVGFIFLIFPVQKSRHYAAGLSFALGFVFLALGYLAEIVLGYHLNSDSAHLFYWSREMLALAWLGHGLVLILCRDQKLIRWLTYGLVLVTVASLILVGATQVTKAEDWFRPAIPIFTQIGDLLATNRPTRWGGWIFNAYGTLVLMAGTFYLLISRKKKTLSSIAVLLLPLGALAFLSPIIWPPATASPSFYIIELSLPILFYFGYSATQVPFSVGKKKRKTK